MMIKISYMLPVLEHSIGLAYFVKKKLAHCYMQLLNIQNQSRQNRS